MLGAIAGDIAGSIWEMNFNTPPDIRLFTSRSRFTDDTVLTVATADVLLNSPAPTRETFAKTYAAYWKLYPHRGYGKAFKLWACAGLMINLDSYGNGCAMRVSPVGWYARTLEETLTLAEDSAWYTHHHEEGRRGAKAIAACVFLARNEEKKTTIARYVADTFGYDLAVSAADQYAQYRASSCQASVPLAIRAFLSTETVEEAIRYAIGIGGDCDTLACMAGAMQEAYTKEVSREMEIAVYRRMDPIMEKVVRQFRSRHVHPNRPDAPVLPIPTLPAAPAHQASHTTPSYTQMQWDFDL